jgi:hypothetical protein
VHVGHTTGASSGVAFRVGPGRVVSSGVLNKEVPGRLTPARNLIKCACQCSGVLCMSGRLPARPHGPSLWGLRLAGRLPSYGVKASARSYQLPSRLGWAAKPISPKKGQGGRSCGPGTGAGGCRPCIVFKPDPAKEGPAHWLARVPACVCKGYKSKAQPGPDLWGQPFGSPARSALRLVIGTGFDPGHHRGQLWGYDIGSAPVVPMLGCIAIPGLRTRGPQLRPRCRGRRLPALQRVQT